MASDTAAPGPAVPGPVALRADLAPPDGLWVDSLDLHNMTCVEELARPAGYFGGRRRRYSGGRFGPALERPSILLAGVAYPHGMRACTPSALAIDLRRTAARFISMVGVADDGSGAAGRITFSVTVEGRRVASSGPLGPGAARLLTVELAGARTMDLQAESAGSSASGIAVWAGALLVLRPGAAALPASTSPYDPPPLAHPIVVPPAAAPAIHGPDRVGLSPGHPFLYRIPATGRGPLIYSASGLPPGLHLDARAGTITGQVPAAGVYRVHLTVSGPAGTGSRPLALVCGPGKLGLTPPMGWDSWYALGDTVTDAAFREMADRLVSSGLAAHGFDTVILDDSWQGQRDPHGELHPNERFPDMKRLVDYVHARGLRFGLLTSATAASCSEYPGSGGHEEQDAATFAAWGVDYLKVDWCPSRGGPVPSAADPPGGDGPAPDAAGREADPIQGAYRRMRRALGRTRRDIFLAVNTYGVGDPSAWAAGIGANSWLTTGRVLDTWETVSQAGAQAAYETGAAGPGHWADLGWLMVGKMAARNPRFTRLTPAEQMAQVSLWSLYGSPLILSCDLRQLDPSRLDPVTTALLTNDYVLAVDQDPLGAAGRVVRDDGSTTVVARPLADGSTAIGLFNKTAWARPVYVWWSDLGRRGPLAVRDLWRRRAMGAFSRGYSASVPAHGVVLIRVGPPSAARRGAVARLAKGVSRQARPDGPSSAPRLLPGGFLSVRGSQIVGPDGTPVRIASVGLTGMNVVGGRLELEGPFRGIPGHVAAMKALGFNCVRVDWIDKTLDDPGAMRQLDRLVAACKTTGLKVIFDNHNNEATPADWENAAQQKNGLWFDAGPGTDGTDGAGNRGTISAAKFREDWVALARHWASNPTVIGFDIRNEPCAHYKRSPPVWGGGGPTDIHAMYEDVGDAILRVNPDALIICEAVVNYETGAYEGDLSPVRRLPVRLNKPGKLVYSVHEYPREIGGYPGPESGRGYVDRMNRTWGWLIRENVAPVWIGEMGASMKSAASREWGKTLLDYMNGQAEGGLRFSADQQPVSGDWWAWGCLTGQNPDGCVGEDGKVRPEQARFIDRMLFRVHAARHGYIHREAVAGTPAPEPAAAAPSGRPLLCRSPRFKRPSIRRSPPASSGSDTCPIPVPASGAGGQGRDSPTAMPAAL